MPVPVQRKVTSIPGRPMPPAPRLSIQIVSKHPHDCTCDHCERERNILRKRYERERAVAAFGEGRC